MFKKIIIGLSIFIIGALMLLSNFKIIQSGIGLFELWPIFIFALGIGEIIDAKRVNITSSILILLGFYFLLYNLDIIDISFGKIVFPFILIIIGIAIIFPKRINKSKFISSKSDVTLTSVFSGMTNKSESKEFNKADITTIFGGATLDLREAKAKNNECLCTCEVVFGGADILIPDDWEVNTDSVTCIFGGIENKKSSSKNNKSTLYLTGTVVFGGIEIK